MNIVFSEDTTDSRLRKISEYADRLTGVTDDFHEEHIYDAEFYDICRDDEKIGYFGIHGGDKITMFYVVQPQLHLAQPVFRRILDEFKIKTAFAATCDELLLSLCLDNHKKIEMQAYFFDGTAKNDVRPPEYGRECISPVQPSELNAINAQTGSFFGSQTKEGLASMKYYIYRLKSEDATLGYGIIVPLRSRPNFWACGMITLPEHRQKGAGRSIQMHLGDICRENGKIPVSGCWYHNRLSKKTIESAGRYTSTRLLNIHFTEE